MKRRAHGFTLLEFVIVLIVFSVLAGVMLERLNFYRAEIERLAVQRVVHAIRSEMYIRTAHLLIAGTPAQIAALALDNPIDWLAEKPPNYGGSFSEVTPEVVSAGNWYYEKATKKLMYFGKNYGEMVKGNQNQLSFRVKVINNEQNAERKNISAGNKAPLLVFVQVTP